MAITIGAQPRPVPNGPGYDAVQTASASIRTCRHPRNKSISWRNRSRF